MSASLMILVVCTLALFVAAAIAALAGVALAGRMTGSHGRERRRLTHRETAAAAPAWAAPRGRPVRPGSQGAGRR